MPTAPGDRIDLASIRDRIELAAIATALFGPAPKRSGRRLLWRCPLHDDRNPSLEIDPARQRWKCWPCNLGGDAIELVMKVRGLAFPDAVRSVAELAGIIALPSKPARPVRSGPARPSMPPARPPGGPPEKAAGRPPDRPAGLDRLEAERIVVDASERLWTPAGADARRYLEGRGLTAETIRRLRLGWADKIRMPKRDGGTWPLSGVTIPWIDSGRVVRIKVRRLGLVKGSRYIEAYADGWRVYPGPEAIRPGMPLAIVEGELDAVLLGQELEDLASVVTTGSSSSRPDGSTWLSMARCSPLFVAVDSDRAGDGAAAEWGGRSVRINPPIEPPAGKDWGDAWKAGIDLRRWWIEHVFADRFDAEERAAIMEYCGGLTREAAELAAGLRTADA